MATLKHISSKNADYGAAEQYLTFQHDEFNMKPVLDENGRLIPREDYRIETLNCGDEDFAIACMRANRRFGKNQNRSDVKSHHYIISFDPRDGTENGLTVDHAQELGRAFAEANFPGHQAMVCTHPDGHNHSGNIHVHIVINSLRISDVERKPYMDRPGESKAGMKHRCTDAAMDYFRAEVMEMCQRENLYQIDLLHGSQNRVTEREYWAKRKGQLALDRTNEKRISEGEAPLPSKFETDKEELRQLIQNALAQAADFDEFAALLMRQGVTVKESRGRLSYLTADRTKPITARKLGDAFDKAAVMTTLALNKQSIPRTQQKQLPQQQPTVSRLVDRDKAKAKGIGYDRWASVFNVKQMAATLNACSEYGFSSPEEVEQAATAAYREMQAEMDTLRSLETQIRDTKEMQNHVQQFRSRKPIREEYAALKTDRARLAYRQKHEHDFILLDAAKQFFTEHDVKKLPGTKALQAQIEQLIQEKNTHYTIYRERKQRYDELATLQVNLQKILRSEPRKEQNHVR